MSDIDFNIKLPKGWQDQTSYYFKGPEIDGFGHEILLNVDRFLQHDDIKIFAREKIDPIVQTMQGIDVLKDEEVTIEEGNPAYEFVYKWIPADEIVEIHKYIFVIMDEMGFMFNIRCNRKSYKMLGSQVKKIVEGLLPGTYTL
ncbi:DcrB-related protein [bacterium]|nr:DcrB-related protein [bacterium]